jgi:predicted HicB family RNase H-like nuclease
METSTLIAQRPWTSIDKNTRVWEGLYITRGGAFFTYRDTERDQVWNERVGQVEENVVEFSFMPKSREQAQEWMLTGEVEVLHNLFEEPPEAVAETETGATLYLRMPATLKRKIDDVAKADDVSANVWAVRCLERYLQASAREKGTSN